MRPAKLNVFVLIYFPIASVTLSKADAFRKILLEILFILLSLFSK